MAELLANRYLLQTRLGSGQQGSVFRAHDQLLDRYVAVKMMLDKDATSAFGESLKREAMLLAKFENPHVVRVYDVVIDRGGQPAIVMELLEGEPLSRCLHTLSSVEVVTFVRQICSAMQQAHQAGLLHRDLKPGNIMLVGRKTAHERFVILDMGIAKLNSASSPDGSAAAQTCAGAGTPLYMAPEQCHGNSGDARTDIYAFGSILYEIYSGTAPFAQYRENLAKLINAVLQESPRSLLSIGPRQSLSAELDSLIQSCLAKNPDYRPQTMSDVLSQFVAAHDMPHVQAVHDAATGELDLYETYIPDRDNKASVPATDGSPGSKSLAAPHPADRTDVPANPKTSANISPVSSNRNWLKVTGLIVLSTVTAFAVFKLLPTPEQENKPNPGRTIEVPPNDPSPPVVVRDVPVQIKTGLTAFLDKAGIASKRFKDDSSGKERKVIDVSEEQLTTELVGLLFDDVLDSGEGWTVNLHEKELVSIQAFNGVKGTLLQLDVSNSEDRIDFAVSRFCIDNRLGGFVASYNMTFSDDHLATVLKTQTQLELLRVTDSGLGASVPQLSPESLNQLRILDLSFNLSMSSEYIVALARVPSIEELYLADTSIEDKDLAAITHPSLRIVDLTNTAVSNAGLLTLAAQAGDSLQKLFVKATIIDDAAVDTLAQMKSLQQVSVGDRLTDAATQRLQTLLPKTEVVTD